LDFCNIYSYICVEENTEKENLFYLIKKRKVQMQKVNTYMVLTSVAPMGYMGAPAADYDCHMGGTGMHKLKV
jgi:hypothetical protein